MTKERIVSLDFPCCVCNDVVGITVQCRGTELSLPETPTFLEGCGQPCQPCAVVTVPCPHCGQINQVYFEPTTPHGRLRAVQVLAYDRPLPVPSVN